MTDSDNSPKSARWSRKDWCFIGALVLVAIALRLWHLTHTVVIARDTIHYSRVAWELGHHAVSAWPDVFRTSEQHPGYPITVWWAYLPVRALVDDAEPYRMQLAAQIASSLASILLVVPIYLLGRQLHDRRVGFGAALLIQCLPVTARLFGDGLSEALFLFLTSTSLLFAVRAVRLPRAAWSCAGAGTFSALAYWVRPEGAVVVGAIGLVLLASQLTKHYRRSWRALALNGAALVVPAALIALPFVLSVRHFTAKPVVKMILDEQATQDEPLHSERASLGKRGQARLLQSHFCAVQNKRACPLFPPRLWAIWWQGGQDPSGRSKWGVKVLFLELIEAGFYAGGIPVLLAWFWLLRRRQWPSPAAWLLIVISLVLSVALWHVAVVGGYLSSRHTILILLCCSFSCVVGLMGISEWIAKRWRRPLANGSVWALSLTLIFAASAMPKTLKPLHNNRTGFREAGEWLAKHAHPSDPITDPYRWSNYYAGRVLRDGAVPPIPPGHQPKEYVVIEMAGNPHRRLRHLPPVVQRVEARPDREESFHRKFRRGNSEADLIIYALPKR